MLEHKAIKARQGGKLLALVLAGGVLALSAAGQTAVQGVQSNAAATKKATSGTPVRFLPNELPRRAQMYYQGVWGVDELRVKQAESGELIRFTWRVLDPVKAKSLNDKKIQPLLIDQRAGVQLVIPTMEKVGQLRQSSTPEAGQSYWMAFSNSGRPVKRGDRVTVVIGQFRAEGLVVQ
ncbi:MAG TPA: hypothetical protein VJQ54_03625 [Candidatus Sulfotelmatobacter sp.]|nr:hypothetical protein [Candidatus Sulfotelmatobacter sp.]